MHDIKTPFRERPSDDNNGMRMTPPTDIGRLTPREVEDRIRVAITIQCKKWWYDDEGHIKSFQCTPEELDRHHSLSRRDMAIVMAVERPGAMSLWRITAEVVRMRGWQEPWRLSHRVDEPTALVETSLCSLRDGRRCILTGSTDAEVCYIAPEGMELSLFVPEDQPDLARAWNMITLTPLLHKWWRRGLWGLKLLKVSPFVLDGRIADVVVEFHWLPWQLHLEMLDDCDAGEPQPGDLTPPTVNALNEQRFAQHSRLMYSWLKEKKELSTNIPYYAWTNGAMEMGHGQVGMGNCPLRSGKQIHIRLPLVEAYAMKAVIDAQWACGQVASVAGSFASSIGEDDDGDLAGLMDETSARWHLDTADS